MLTVCCSNECERRFECAKADINNEGINYCEDFYNFGSGSISSEGCTERWWCSEKGNWGMFEQVEHKWNNLTEIAPPVSKEVEIKVLVDDEGKNYRIYTDRLIPLVNGNYIWQYGDYSGYCVEAWRHISKY